MKKDFFNNEIPNYTHFMWKLEHISLKMKDTFANEFADRLHEINSTISKNDLYIINTIIFEEKVTKKSISNFLKKDAGNISRNIDVLIKEKIIEKETVSFDGKKKMLLSISDKFYKQYIVLANEFSERAFKMHFINIIEDIAKNSEHEAMGGIAELVKKLEFQY